MASLRDLRKSIASVKTTQQTTRAMKLVSAAKLRRSQDAITAHRPYSRGLDAILKQIGSIAVNKLPYFSDATANSVDASGDGKLKKVLVVMISSDRGLCGGFNTNVTKAGLKWVIAQKDLSEITYAFVGKKGWELVRTRLSGSTPFLQREFGSKVSFKYAQELASSLVAAFDEGQFDEIKVVYSEFKNAMTQSPVVENFLPIEKVAMGVEDGSAGFENAILKPGAEALARSLLKKHFSTQFYRMMLESQAGEHGARMSAMESATKNAGEMIRKLTLAYNKSRQAAITKELLEIISGSEAQKTS